MLKPPPELIDILRVAISKPSLIVLPLLVVDILVAHLSFSLSCILFILCIIFLEGSLASSNVFRIFIRVSLLGRIVVRFFFLMLFFGLWVILSELLFVLLEHGLQLVLSIFELCVSYSGLYLFFISLKPFNITLIFTFLQLFGLLLGLINGVPVSFDAALLFYYGSFRLNLGQIFLLYDAFKEASCVGVIIHPYRVGLFVVEPRSVKCQRSIFSVIKHISFLELDPASVLDHSILVIIGRFVRLHPRMGSDLCYVFIVLDIVGVKFCYRLPDFAGNRGVTVHLYHHSEGINNFV